MTRGLGIVPALLTSALLAACGGARHARVTSVTSVTSGAGTATVPAHPSQARRRRTQRQEKVLAVAYRRMRSEPDVDDFDIAPRDIEDYGIERLWARGDDGAGTTIAVMEEWDDPSLTKQIGALDRALGLPNPKLTTIYPAGDHRLPSRCPLTMVKLGPLGSCQGWERELYLDVAAAHLIAPYARIVISVTPAETELENVSNTPEIMRGVEQISRQRLADVISISSGSGETTYPYGPHQVTAQDPGELMAAAAGIPVVAATGDCGPVTDTAEARSPCTPTTARRGISTWADSPWTLAVGGSTPSAAADGARIESGAYPESAGFSSIFHRPRYQPFADTGSTMRSVPDITMDNQDGTSEAAPLMAGVLALATQANGGRDLGPINTALYDTLGPRGAADGILDITQGSDSLLTPQGAVRAQGFTAHQGFDVATGWGTIDGPRFVPALVRATRASHDERTARAQATAALMALSRAMHLSPARVARTGTVHLVATGFLARFPVVLSIDGRQVATLDADRSGDISAAIAPARLQLAAGTHRVALRSMLITVTGRFVVGSGSSER